MPQGSLAPEGLLSAQASRLHKLKGSAATLGARLLAMAASSAEDACRNHEIDRLPQLLLDVSSELTVLRRSATPVIERLRMESAATMAFTASSAAKPVDEAALALLIEALQQSDLNALDQAEQLSGGLQQALGGDAYGRFKDQIDNLDFDGAASALLQLTQA